MNERISTDQQPEQQPFSGGRNRPEQRPPKSGKPLPELPEDTPKPELTLPGPVSIPTEGQSPDSGEALPNERPFRFGGLPATDEAWAELQERHQTPVRSDPDHEPPLQGDGKSDQRP
jgi:hypothetical protein